MKSLLKAIAIAFLLFTLWIIYAANTGKDNLFFDIVIRIPNGDKFGHFFLFGILTLLLNLALEFRSYQRLPLGTVFVFVFVVLEEWSQYFLPDRSLDIVDLIANWLGVLIFTYISFLLYKNKTLEFKKLNEK